MIFISLIATPPPWSYDRWRDSEKKKKRKKRQKTLTPQMSRMMRSFCVPNKFKIARFYLFIFWKYFLTWLPTHALVILTENMKVQTKSCILKRYTLAKCSIDVMTEQKKKKLKNYSEIRCIALRVYANMEGILSFSVPSIVLKKAGLM